MPVYIGTVVAVSSLAQGVSVVLLRSSDQPRHLVPRLLATVGALMLGHRIISRASYGRNAAGVSASPAAALVALALLPAPWVPLLVAACVAVDDVRARRARLKMIFNVAASGLSAALAALTYSAIHGSSGQATLLVALFVAGLVEGVSALVLVSGVISVSAAMDLREVLLRERWWPLASACLTSGLGVLIVGLALDSPLTLALIPICVVLVVLLMKARRREADESDIWRELDAASADLDTLAEGEVVRIAVTRTSRLLRAAWVEVDVQREAAGVEAPGQGPAVQRHHGDHNAITHAGSPATDRQLRMRAVPARRAGEDDQPVLVGTDTDGSTVAETPLRAESGTLGALRVGFADGHRFTSRERQLLATYARAVGSALLNARMHAAALAAAERRAWQARHDELTGLLSRRGILELEDELVVATADAETWAVLVIDLDRFKRVNETLGSQAGDRLLQHVATVLRARSRPGDAVGRLDGDRFALVVRHLPGEGSTDAICDDVLARVSATTDYEGLRLSLDVSVGVAVSPTDGSTLEAVLRHAEIALADAKQNPGSWRRYRPAKEGVDRDSLALSAELRAGLELGEIFLHFQPQVDMATGRVLSAEALARWQHPTRGVVAPNVFIPVAEGTGMAHDFTIAVLNLAVREAAGWRTDGLGDIPVAVNLSARNLLDRQLPTDVAVVLATHGLPARLLVLEITETVAMSELDVVEDVIARLRNLGVEISVDDFGTGYSSLTFLQRVRVNEVKVDQSFVQRMVESDEASAIVRATIDLAHGLGLRVTAEGVEDAATYDKLGAMHCDLAQGYFVARPMPAEHFRRHLVPDGGVVVALDRSRRRRA